MGSEGPSEAGITDGVLPCLLLSMGSRKPFSIAPFGKIVSSPPVAGRKPSAKIAGRASCLLGPKSIRFLTTARPSGPVLGGLPPVESTY